MSKVWTSRRVTLGNVSTAAIALMLLGTPAAGMAQTSSSASTDGQAATLEIDIPAQPLGDALRRFAEATGVQLGYSTALVAGKTSSAVHGKATVPEALARLLAGTGITATLTGRNATLHETVAADGERVAGTVRVEGVQGSPYNGGAGQAAGVNGVNGSRDITATEGTKSFTSGALTVGGKSVQSIKDTPQSVSVMTSERLEQQAITTYNEALKVLPGISSAQGDSSIETTFYSRGFAVNSVQVDGGAPLKVSDGIFAQIDMSMYDHIELLRGAATFNGYGDPSGTVNLARKKPLDHQQVAVELQAGSWQNYRIVADISSPLGFDGKLRGRLVSTYQDRHFFYNTAKDNKALIYGIVELDATPTTLVTMGGSYTRQNSVPWLHGLPRYITGADLNLPRSTSFVFPWNRWNFRTTEIFGSVNQKLGDDWSAKLNVTYNQQNSVRKLGYSNGSVNPLTDAGATMQGLYNNFPSKQYSYELTVDGAFEVLGQRQEVTFGLNRTKRDQAGRTNYGILMGYATAASPYVPYPGGPAYYSGSVNGAYPPIDVFNFDPSDPRYSEPATPFAINRLDPSNTVQTTAYANLRLTAFDRIHLNTVLRWTRFESDSVFESLCDGAAWCTAYGYSLGDVIASSKSANSQSRFAWPPTASLSFDLTRTLVAYAGYSDIYDNQANLETASGVPLPPITGSNIEAGFKWQARDGKLNATISVYRTRKTGWGILDGDEVDVGNGNNCCYYVDPERTSINKGFEAEVTGEPITGLQIAASYAYNRSNQVGTTFGTANGKPSVSIQPKNVYKVWASYDFGASGYNGILSRLTLSGGVSGQSSAYRSGYSCINLLAPNALGVSRCATYALPNYVPYEFTVPAYAVVSGRIDYQLSDEWSASVNLDNIFDKTYYQSVGAATIRGNWYGAPRSVLVSLRGKW
ncbi:outer-membrane receptor for ferric coprogen and ferric-rhodotorulic acid [Novosphingobium sp. CF614]|uniref:TonB-dependent siderophore receptor n=1 Tax=Novosphingobium sp. CF614 TaxID=1884364 RepID=UPI0008EAD31A|nr:TonB-dependent receptor [Novosphingobium sp. CF614]SFF82668.1 outer-membrane receptor for ferric coprogen and ferric-rhodotorulic acid [Novosphingobium sp. CF614]